MPGPNEFALRILVGGLLGATIGLERQWRQRGAGLHTSALVAIGAALFTLLGPVIGSDSETRILANIVTGVGFLAGGVILRQGTSVSGLNTAATIWALAGVGQIAHAAMGSAAIIVFNVTLQPLVERIDRQAAVYQELHGEKRYRVLAACDEAAVTEVRAAIVERLKATKLDLRSIATEKTEEGYEIRTEIHLQHRDDSVIEGFCATLSPRADVRDVTWHMLDLE